MKVVKTHYMWILADYNLVFPKFERLQYVRQSTYMKQSDKITTGQVLLVLLFSQCIIFVQKNTLSFQENENENTIFHNLSAKMRRKITSPAMDNPIPKIQFSKATFPCTCDFFILAFLRALIELTEMTK